MWPLLAEQEELIASLERSATIQSRLWRALFSLLAVLLALFFLRSALLQAQAPWERVSHPGQARQKACCTIRHANGGLLCNMSQGHSLRNELVTVVVTCLALVCLQRYHAHFHGILSQGATTAAGEPCWPRTWKVKGPHNETQRSIRIPVSCLSHFLLLEQHCGPRQLVVNHGMWNIFVGKRSYHWLLQMYAPLVRFSLVEQSCIAAAAPSCTALLGVPPCCSVWPPRSSGYGHCGKLV